MNHGVEYYLSKGFEPAAAEYYASGRKKIIKVTPREDFKLVLDFDNGERRMYDCNPLFGEGTVFEKFRDFDNFKRVYLDSEHCVAWDIDPHVDSEVVWENKVDICPDSCYIDSVPIS